MLPIENLLPHPLNPRKDLGDLTELADSIRAQGVLQNLTVVPEPLEGPDKYRILIGHRRHAAAKLAGLTELPCSDCLDENEERCGHAVRSEPCPVLGKVPRQR
ncbi:MAG: ParB N-terminal domain-containing protein [Clostridium sp.]|nr:ParB N-terminal domain-containing protein [Clostridium sp.]